MDIVKKLYVIDRKAWHDWLEANFKTAKEIWLVYPSKLSGKPRVSYNDAVEEALSFGWIDSTMKKIDDRNNAQRFTPRNPHSAYSQANKERLKWLLKEGKVHPSVLPAVKKALKAKFVFPPDILQAIRANPAAWKNYRKFSPAFRRIRIAYIEGARKRPEEFKKRLHNFIRMSEKNKQAGFGGIEKYYRI